jgi:hypothetical protein
VVGEEPIVDGPYRVADLPVLDSRTQRVDRKHHGGAGVFDQPANKAPMVRIGLVDEPAAVQVQDAMAAAVRARRHDIAANVSNLLCAQPGPPTHRAQRFGFFESLVLV